MPASMIHLLTACKVDPSASTLFLIGNIAPDVLSARKEKDESHFRNIPDRAEVLIGLANSTDKNDSFREGILLHLYLDWQWDIGPFNKFQADNVKEDWFLAYRHELFLSGCYLYHHTPWAKKIWDEMCAFDFGAFEERDFYTYDNIRAYVQRNYKWHEDNNIGPSEVFDPEFIEAFTSRVAADFTLWRK